MEEGTVLLKQPSEDRMTRTVILHYHPVSYTHLTLPTKRIV